MVAGAANMPVEAGEEGDRDMDGWCDDESNSCSSSRLALLAVPVLASLAAMR